MNAAIPLITVSCVQGRGRIHGICAPQATGPSHFRRPGRHGRSLIIQAKYGTLPGLNLKSFASHEKGEALKKTLMALGAAAALTVSAVALPAPAHAQRGVAAGVAAGLIG